MEEAIIKHGGWEGEDECRGPRHRNPHDNPPAFLFRLERARYGLVSLHAHGHQRDELHGAADNVKDTLRGTDEIHIGVTSPAKVVNSTGQHDWYTEETHDQVPDGEVDQ